jgi:hypothetical protein
LKPVFQLTKYWKTKLKKKSNIQKDKKKKANSKKTGAHSG